MMSFLRQLFLRRRLDPFPSAWKEILDGNVPYYDKLQSQEKDRLDELIQAFIASKSFEATRGLKIDDEIKVSIAGQACLLLLGVEAELFPTVRTVIVYPGAYVARGTRPMPEGTQIELHEVRMGESWGHGTVLLSWQDVLDGAFDPADGWNIVLHEFAHQLDEETGESNGAPRLPPSMSYARWHAVFSRAFERHGETLRSGRDPEPLDEYAAESPAEFFAVVTEVFFERPAALHAYDAELYTQLRSFYGQDPISRF